MTKPPDSKPPEDARKARLAQALRDNLKRRKSQARERKEHAAEGGEETPAPTEKPENDPPS